MCFLAFWGIVASIILFIVQYSGNLKLGLLCLSILFAFQGVTFIFLSMLGEYIGRSYLLLNGKPQFTFYPDQSINNHDSEGTK